MIRYRHDHPVVRKKLPGAVCGMEPIRIYNAQGQPEDIPTEAYAFGVCYAGYNTELYRDDIVYIAINTHWESVSVTLPVLDNSGLWSLTADTHGDEYGKYYYPEGAKLLTDRAYLLAPRSIAIFTAKTY